MSTVLVVIASIFFFIASCVHAGPLTTMPEKPPTDPKEYIDKWDPFVLKPLIGTKESLSRNNGRQIARDSQGAWYVLVEKDQQALYLGIARGERVVGGDMEMMELVGTSPKAVFKAQGNVIGGAEALRAPGGSMVVDREDTLHVIWCDKEALYYASRKAGASAWGAAKRLADAPCHPGDIMLDADGRAAVCYSREDTVYYLSLPEGRPEAAGGVGAGMPPLVMPVVPKAEPPKKLDPAAPQAPAEKKPSYPPPRPISERECRDAAMDLGPDGSVHLAFQRDFDIWYARRAADGK